MFSASRLEVALPMEQEHPMISIAMTRSAARSGWKGVAAVMVSIALASTWGCAQQNNFAGVRCVQKHKEGGKWVTVPPQPKCNHNLP